MAMKASILIVDDDPDILTVLKANLQLHGFEAVTASTCAEAEERLNEQLPDLVVLDRVLPDGEGVEMCRKWSNQVRGLPIIMLTALDTVSDRVLGLESGADDYVVKPFEPLELVARIKACLRRLKPEGGSVSGEISAGSLHISRTSMTATLRDEPLELTPKEYQLLCLLAEHQGEVLNRDFIRKSLWKDSQIYSWSRVIDVHIQHLRQKIEEDPSNPQCIVTMPGMGYKFMPPKAS
jgi:DNA-binding response OmpR family regulator